MPSTTESIGESRRDRIERKLQRAVDASESPYIMPQMPICTTDPSASRAIIGVLEQHTKCINDFACGQGGIAEYLLAQMNGGLESSRRRRKEDQNTFSAFRGMLTGSGRLGVLFAAILTVVMIMLIAVMTWYGKITLENARTLKSLVTAS